MQQGYITARLVEEQDFLKTREGVDDNSRALQYEDRMILCTSSVQT